jgi:hypothetical protein
MCVGGSPEKGKEADSRNPKQATQGSYNTAARRVDIKSDFLTSMATKKRRKKVGKIFLSLGDFSVLPCRQQLYEVLPALPSGAYWPRAEEVHV